MRWIPFAAWTDETPQVRDETFIALRARHHAIRDAWQQEQSHRIDVEHITCESCGNIIDGSASFDALTIECPTCKQRLNLPPYMRGKGTWNYPIEPKPIIWKSQTSDFIKGVAMGMLTMMLIVGIIAAAYFVLTLQ